MKWLNIIFLLFVSSTLSAQKIDFNNDKDTSQLRIINKIVKKHRYSHPDSCIKLIEFGIKLAQPKNLNSSLALLTSYKGDILWQKGDLHKSIANYEKSLELYKILKDSFNISKAYGNLGYVYADIYDYSKALSCCSEAYRIARAIKDDYLVVSMASYMTHDYFAMNDYTNALKYEKEGLYYWLAKDSVNYGNCLNNIGNAFYNLSEYDSAMFYFINAIKVLETVQKGSTPPEVYDNISRIYYQKNDLKNAYRYLNAALHASQIKVRTKVEDYINLARIHGTWKTKDSTFYFLYKAFGMAKAGSDLPALNEVHLELAYQHEQVKRYDSAAYYRYVYIELNDSLRKAGSKAEMIRLQASFDNEKKQFEIDIRQKEINNQQTIIKQEALVKKALVGILLLVILVCLFAYRAYRLKKKSNQIILKQKTLVEQQKHLIEEKQKEIIDSLNYAARIQRSLMSNENYVSKYLNKKR